MDAESSAALKMVQEGKRVFRSETFGDEAFWGDSLKLHTAIEGERLEGGVGPGLTPTAALDLGLKVDVDALPASVVQGLKDNTVDLNDPATTLALLKAKAVVGITGVMDSSGNGLRSVGIQCALCHSTVDDSLAPGIGHRLDGWANHDLNVGEIIALAPDLSAIVNVLKAAPGNESLTQDAVRGVLKGWGPGKFDAELILDGKGTRPDGKTAATLIPNAFAVAGMNEHTWTGGFGNVLYWNAFVAVLEMHGKGTFLDARLDDMTRFPDVAARYPVAVANKLGHIQVGPDEDKVSKNLPALHLYQITLSAPTPTAGTDFDKAASDRGDQLFSGKAKCDNCHVEPLWTEPGYNAHRPDEIGIDDFQASRSPDGTYKTANLAGVFIRERGIHMKAANKGRFYHDGRFATLMDVVNHYQEVLALGLTDAEKNDLVEYLKSL